MYRTEKIAILMATYNGENYIKDQLDSILAQTDTEWTLYVHDDGSKDGTMCILEDYQKRYPEQITLIDGAPTGGAKQNFFYLFSCVEAPYYMCCDQDDVWLPDKIKTTRKKMQDMEKNDRKLPCLVFTELKVVDENLSVIAEKMSKYQGLDCNRVTLNRTLIQNVVTGCTMMVNRSLRDELTKVTEYKYVLMHDWWAMLIATRFGKVAFIETSTILYRQHENNGVGARNSNSMLYMIKRMMQGREIKASLINTRNQAEYFAKVYGESEDSMIKRYSQIGEKGKLNRLKFYTEHNIKKSTWSKNLGLILWG